MGEGLLESGVITLGALRGERAREGGALTSEEGYNVGKRLQCERVL